MTAFWDIIVMLWHQGNIAGLFFFAFMFAVVVFICVDGVKRGA